MEGPADEQGRQKSLWNFVTANHPVVLGVVFDHLSSIEGLPHEAFILLANCNREREREERGKREIDYCWE